MILKYSLDLELYEQWPQNWYLGFSRGSKVCMYVCKICEKYFLKKSNATIGMVYLISKYSVYHKITKEQKGSMFKICTEKIDLLKQDLLY